MAWFCLVRYGMVWWLRCVNQVPILSMDICNVGNHRCLAYRSPLLLLLHMEVEVEVDEGIGIVGYQIEPSPDVHKNRTRGIERGYECHEMNFSTLLFRLDDTISFCFVLFGFQSTHKPVHWHWLALTDTLPALEARNILSLFNPTSSVQSHPVQYGLCWWRYLLTFPSSTVLSSWWMSFSLIPKPAIACHSIRTSSLFQTIHFSPTIYVYTPTYCT